MLDALLVGGAGRIWLGFLIVLVVLVLMAAGAFLFAWKKLKVGAPTPTMAIDEAKKIRETVEPGWTATLPGPPASRARHARQSRVWDASGRSVDRPLRRSAPRSSRTAGARDARWSGCATRSTELTDWRAQVRRNQKNLLTVAAAAAGFVIAGGIGGAGALLFGRAA